MDKMFTKIKKKTTHTVSFALSLSLSQKIRISDHGESVQDEAIVVKRQSLTRKQKTFPGF